MVDDTTTARARGSRRALNAVPVASPDGATTWQVPEPGTAVALPVARAKPQRLTKAVVESIPVPGKADKAPIVWDSELRGFGLRVGASGTRTFFIQQRTRLGRQVYVKLGRFGVAYTAERTRQDAKRILGDIAGGADPCAELKAARVQERERRAAKTLAEFRDTFVERHCATLRRHAPSMCAPSIARSWRGSGSARS